MIDGARCVLSWSGGKDCAYTYFELLQMDVEVDAILVTVSDEYQRASHHGVKQECLIQQADKMDVSLDIVEIPVSSSNQEYEEAMKGAIDGYVSRGFEYIAFGDIHLEDIKRYREKQLDGTGLSGRWPIWGLDTSDLIESFIEKGFNAMVVAVNTDYLGERWLGRMIDMSFVEELPGEVDPCGENGEYHTFVFKAPFFKNDLDVSTGQTISRSFDDTEIKYLDIEAE